MAHDLKHLLQTYIGTYATGQQYLVLARVRHGPLGHLYQHSECILLQGKTNIFQRGFLQGVGRCRGQAGKGEIHTFDNIGQGDV